MINSSSYENEVAIYTIDEDDAILNEQEEKITQSNQIKDNDNSDDDMINIELSDSDSDDNISMKDILNEDIVLKDSFINNDMLWNILIILICIFICYFIYFATNWSAFYIGLAMSTSITLLFACLEMLNPKDSIWINKIFGNDVLCILGKYSYGMYLTHVPITKLLDFYSILPNTGYFRGIIIVLVTFYISYILWILVENPAMSKFKLKKPKRFIMFMICLTISQPFLLKFMLNINNSTVKDTIPSTDFFYNDVEEVHQLVEEGLNIKSVDPSIFSMSAFDKDCGINPKPEHYEYIDDDEYLENLIEKYSCTYGDINATDAIYIIGNSYSHMFLEVMHNIGLNLNLKVKTAVLYSAQFAFLHDAMINKTEFASDAQKLALKLYEKILGRIRNANYFLVAEKFRTSYDKNINYNIPYLEYLNAIAPVKVILFPFVINNGINNEASEITQCVHKYVDDIQQCSFKILNNGHSYSNDLSDDEIKSMFDGLSIHYTTIIDLYCKNLQCPMVIDNHLVYRAGHLNAPYLNSLTKLIQNRLALK